ncbi:type VI secretion protein [Burkholderia ubonensis]|uniref:type VI secretion system protein TssA n=1 Tax=Burkholderia ubonensis TaxID=101571 RepID=UPI00075CA121|nr:type VI secretion system protein TssA [Burkholderia ubonensis]KVP58485.1 type VI secretion protein [Burkholderia ubonensis]
MAKLDTVALLADISSDHPGGVDVEYDPAFLELEQAVYGKPDVQYGDTVVAATQPDWKAAESLSFDLLSKSHDLRVAGHLARALLNRQGFAGFADGLALIEGLLERCWDSIYPRLDPDDDNDPTARVNALAVLVESSGMVADVRDAPLAMSRAQGIARLRDVEYASGESAAPAGVATLSAASIDAIVADARDDAAATHAAVAAALRNAMRIETLLTERVGAARSIDLSPLSRLLRHASAFLGERVAPAAPEAANDTPVDGAAVVANLAAVPASSAAPGEIASRQDVIRTLDRICAYYEQHEPSSPVPLLLSRARRLVDKTFIEILEDLAPEGLGQARQAGGIAKE